MILPSCYSLTPLFFISLLAANHLLLAQEKPAPFTIEELVTQALESNPELQFYEAEIASAKAGRREAGRLGNPELDFDFGRKRSTGADFRSEGVAYAVALAQPLEWPGRIGLRKAIADGEIDLAELGLKRFKYALAGQVRQLAFRVSIAQEKAAVARDVAGRFNAVKDVLLQREVGGIAPHLEIKVIDAATMTMEKESLEAAVEVQMALLELNQLMGRSAVSPLVVARAKTDFPDMPEVARLMELAVERNYEMQVLRAELAQQGFRVSLAKNERYPTIKVGPYVSREEAGEVESEAGIGFSLELPIFRNGKAKVSQAQAREAQAEATINAAARRLEREVASAALVYLNSRKQLQGWPAERIDALQDSAQSADRHYRLGAVPVATYIELQEKYLEALEAVNDVKADALEAWLTIEQLTGATPEFD
tara:strand:- start:1407 stop:2678 length:1272 start_codon:yes stop_codon:yes gene_type:complete